MVSEPLFSIYKAVAELLSVVLEEQAVSKIRVRTREKMSRFIVLNYKAFVNGQPSK